MGELPKLIEIPKERIIEQFENGEINIEYIAYYIEKLNIAYNLLIDRYNEQIKYNKKLRNKYIEFKKGLNKVMKRSKIWKERCYRERRKVKEMKRNG